MGRDIGFKCNPDSRKPHGGWRWDLGKIGLTGFLWSWHFAGDFSCGKNKIEQQAIVVGGRRGINQNTQINYRGLWWDWRKNRNADQIWS